MTKLGRQITCIATTLLALGCGGPAVPAAPYDLRGAEQPSVDPDPGSIPDVGTGGTDDPGPLPPANPGSHGEDKELGYEAECATVEEPNGAWGTDPYYIRRTFEVVLTLPGQRVVVTSCGRYGQLLGRPYEDDPEECETVEVTSISAELRVECSELKDTTNVPDIVNGGVDERAWRRVFIKTLPPPQPITCDEQRVVEAPAESIVDTRYQEIVYIPWELGDTILVSQCGCYDEYRGNREEDPRCTVRAIEYAPIEQIGGDIIVDSSNAFALTCLSIINFRDGTVRETGCTTSAYRLNPFGDVNTED